MIPYHGSDGVFGFAWDVRGGACYQYFASTKVGIGSLVAVKIPYKMH
jgi:hypothetical protein